MSRPTVAGDRIKTIFTFSRVSIVKNVVILQKYSCRVIVPLQVCVQYYSPQNVIRFKLISIFVKLGLAVSVELKYNRNIVRMSNCLNLYVNDRIFTSSSMHCHLLEVRYLRHSDKNGHVRSKNFLLRNNYRLAVGTYYAHNWQCNAQCCEKLLMNWPLEIHRRWVIF